MRYVRGSEVSSLLRCRKQWKYSWHDKLEPRRQDNKLFFGNLAHKFLETYYANLDDEIAEHIAMEEMMTYFRESDTSGMEQVELDDLWELVADVMQNYVEQWREHNAGITVLATELRFAIPLDEDTAYEGTIDLVFLDRDQRLLFKDYKNVQSIERYVGMAAMDRQISRYWWALTQLARGNGYIWDSAAQEWVHVRINEGQLIKRLLPMDVTQLKEPSGFIYDLVLKDVPTIPELLKPKKNEPIALSKAKNQKTTVKVYMEAMRRHGLITNMSEDPLQPEEIWSADYDGILEHLRAQESEFGNRFFRRIPVVRNENECQAAMQEFLSVVDDMVSVEYRIAKNEKMAALGLETSHDPTYRNINADCSWCNYRALCVAEMDGVNAEFIRNTLYRPKEDTLNVREDDAE